MTDPTRSPDDRLREAAQAFIEASVLVDTITINNGPAYQDAWDAYHFAQAELRAALAEAAPAPDLLAAVEALRDIIPLAVRSMGGFAPFGPKLPEPNGEIFQRDKRAIERAGALLRSTSREAGLDALIAERDAITEDYETLVLEHEKCASREAGLDAELVAQAVRNVLMRTSFSAWVGNEPPYIEEIGQRVAAEYVRLAASPVTEK